MGSLEDQLKQWKKQQSLSGGAAEPAKTPSSSSNEPARKKPTKKDPFPKQTLKKEEPKKTAPPPPAPKKSDAELFAEAVDNVDEDVVLEKFSQAAAVGTTKKAQKAPPPPPTDEELFALFLGDDSGPAPDGKKLVKLKK